MGQVLFNPRRNGIPRMTEITGGGKYQEIMHVEQAGGYC